MAIRSIAEAELEGKKVLARFDFNVPLGDRDASGTRAIKDSTRIDLSLKTIQYILDQKPSKLILMSHLGRPKGKPNPDYSLEPVAKYLAEKLGLEVYLSESPTDSGLKTLTTLGHIKVVLLENLRFDPREEQGDHEFAQALASLADVYVNDAFGAAHRKHASVYTITEYFNRQRYAGFLILDEIEALDKILHKPQKPFVGILGGAKVSDKIQTIEKLLITVDHLIIGGAMAYPFLKAQGKKIGKSLCAESDVTLAAKILKADKGHKLVLPMDHVVAENPDAPAETTSGSQIDGDKAGFDIGPQSIENIRSLVSTAKTLVWNGPMGLFEKSQFSKGTFSVAQMLAESDAYSFVGGGDSVAAVKQSGYADKISHVSSGGGASLEYIEKGTLPGIQALKYHF